MNASARSVVVFFLAWAAAGASAQPNMPERDAVEQAPFIFKGTVSKTRASNVAAVPAAPDTAVVRVDEILKAPDVFRAFAKKTITVKLKPGTSVRAEQRALFLTAGWMYGDSIAVREVALASPTLDSAALTDLIADVERAKGDRALSGRIAASATVVAGRVADVSPLQAADKAGLRSEHDPDFWRAEIEVIGVEKPGARVGERVTVFFPHSTDEFWLKSPKLSNGQQAIFLLHKVPPDARDLKFAADSGYLVTDALDVQPLGTLDRVRSLIAKER
jgi:hypothetical protein